MTQFPRVGKLAVSAMILAGSAAAAQNIDAAAWAGKAQQAFSQGDFSGAAKSYEHAVKIDPENTVYLEGLGRTYEREAEQSAFPILLSSKARRSLQRALRMDPNNAAALQDLVELEQQPIGLCEGNLSQASLLIDHLATIDPDAATREQVLHADAVVQEQRAGQKILCGPVKATRLLTDPILNPRRRLLVPSDLSRVAAPDAVVSRTSELQTVAQGQ